MDIQKLFNDLNKVSDTINYSEKDAAQLIHIIKLILADEYQSFYIT